MDQFKDSEIQCNCHTTDPKYRFGLDSDYAEHEEARRAEENTGQELVEAGSAVEDVLSADPFSQDDPRNSDNCGEVIRRRQRDWQAPWFFTVSVKQRLVYHTDFDVEVLMVRFGKNGPRAAHRPITVYG